MANSYITLTDSAAVKSKRFRVLQEGYDDGTWNRSENIRRLIGGGLDHSYGATYRTWNALIKVRHTETDANYGALSDLEYFYKLNNPAGSPNTTLTFVDHHGTSLSVQIVGQMPKNALSCSIEGTTAWFIYKIQLIEVT
jgi:hypothetical protein